MFLLANVGVTESRFCPMSLPTYKSTHDNPVLIAPYSQLGIILQQVADLVSESPHARMFSPKVLIAGMMRRGSCIVVEIPDRVRILGFPASLQMHH